jgi:hypothetical protein
MIQSLQLVCVHQTTTFELLGDIIPHELKQQIEREKKKAEEEILEELHLKCQYQAYQHQLNY